MHPKSLRDDGLTAAPQDAYQEVARAIKAGDCGSLDTLLARQRPDGRDQRNGSLFEAAVKSGRPELVRCLLRYGVVPHHESPVFPAIREVEALKVVLAEGYPVDVASSARKSPLHAAIAVNPACVPVLLRAGCDVTSRDSLRGNTPLHSACIQCEEDSILRVVQAGASMNCANDAGETPLFCLLQHACLAGSWRDFHVRSRHGLARCLIHMGMTLTPPLLLPLASPAAPHAPPPAARKLSKGPLLFPFPADAPRRSARRDVTTSAGDPLGGSKGYKVTRVYRQLLSDTRLRAARPLQHLCRVRVRELCERHVASLERGSGPNHAGGGGGGRRVLEGQGRDCPDGIIQDDGKELPRLAGLENEDAGSKPEAVCGPAWKGTSPGRPEAHRNLGEVFKLLGIPKYLQDYLLYKHHVLDKGEFISP